MTRISRLLAMSLLWMLCAASIAQEVRRHLVQPGETLYGLANRYNVSIPQLKEANPLLEGDNLPAGTMLTIPPSAAEAVTAAETTQEAVGTDEADKRVKRKAISFGKSHRHKSGDTPQSATDTADSPSSDGVQRPDHTQVVADEAPTIVAGGETPVGEDNDAGQGQEALTDVLLSEYDGIVDVAVIQRFNLDAKTLDDEKQQRRSVELYEGLLLAIDEAQRQGTRIAVQTYDTGTRPLSDILADAALAKADIIVASLEQSEAEAVAAFGESRGINVVSPMAFDASLAGTSRHLFQLNTQKNMLYDGLAREVQTRFSDRSIVFLTDSTQLSKREGFVPVLKNDLRSRGIPFQEFGYNNPAALQAIDERLGIEGKKLLLIPETATREALRRMFPCLMYLVAPVAADEEEGADVMPVVVERQHEAADVAVLGYPEWVLYTDEFMNYYYDLNVFMFAKFYVNPFDADVKDFYQTFKHWYGREPMQLYPKYALLGYDLGRFFIGMLDRYGRAFGPKALWQESQSLQNALYFEPTQGGGLINKAFYLVNFKPNAEIEKYVVH